MAPIVLDRREFLARIGYLGAAVGVLGPGALRALPADAQTAVNQVLAALSRDTFNGLVSFVVPGSDAYSVAQGVQVASPGAIDARTTDFLIQAADFFVPLPDGFARSMVSAFRTGAGAFPIPPSLIGVPLELAKQVDDAILALIGNDDTVPLSIVFAMTMNFYATRVNPAAAAGGFLSPFARLSWNEKAAAWQMFEEADPTVVALIDGQLPEPQTETVSGVLRFAAGALLEFAGFGTYGEYSTFDRATRTLSGPPVGFAISNYTPAAAGWDEFKGYWKGRTAADP